MIDIKEQKIKSINEVVKRAHERIYKIQQKAIESIEIIETNESSLSIDNKEEKLKVMRIVEDALKIKSSINSTCSHGNIMTGKKIYAAILHFHYKSSINEIAALIYNNARARQNVYHLFESFNDLYLTEIGFQAQFKKCVNLCRQNFIYIVKRNNYYQIKIK